MTSGKVEKIKNMKSTNNIKLILASSSPRRKKILQQAGISFKAINTNTKEELLIKKFRRFGFIDLAKLLSLAKAIGAYLNKPKKQMQDNEVIVAFDTMVVCKNKIISKPKNNEDALRKLLFLSNKKHIVITGICILDLKKKKIILDFEETQVYMKRISKEEAIQYVKTKEPLGKAGAYAIQGKGKQFIQKIKGDYLNVVGLPLERFLKILKTFVG